ncbi:MAG: molybdopterin molybdotransferase MoeA [Planctomycetaceae bacterium]|nr:molybdopterin molybdotransferase MoeA [Planctomycetaceae bacterium]
MLSVQEALDTIVNRASGGSPVTESLAAAYGCVPAENLIIPHDSPPFDKSMMDGFAVRSGDFAAEGRRVLKVCDTITAGMVFTGSVAEGTCLRIMTGCPVPPDTDCVVPFELTELVGDGSEEVTVAAENVRSGANILRQGTAAKTGEVLAAAGTRLTPQYLATLAEFGFATVKVFRRPRVSVVATGDELVAANEPLGPGQIRNSNEPMLAAQIARAGAVAQPLGIARDNVADLTEKIRQGLSADVLLLSGGVSAGTADLVPSVLNRLGVQQVFHKVAIKPGKPLWFGHSTGSAGECLVFGLPGNPVSSMVCFELFVRSALRKLCGIDNPIPIRHTAVLTADVTIRGDRPTYYPCVFRLTENGPLATPVAWEGSADLRSTTQANAMLILAPQPKPYLAGQNISVILWNSWYDE